MNRSIWLALALAVLTVGCGVQSPLQVGTINLPDAAVQQSYAAQLTALGGNVPITWSLASGSLPPGVSLSPVTGVLSGSPQAVGEFDFSVRATQTMAPQISALSHGLKINVKKAGSTVNLAITNTTLASGTTKVPYDAALIATGGTTPYVWSVASGSLPPGITVNSSAGTLTGTPTAAGSFSFTVALQDSSRPTQHAAQALSISISAASTTSPLTISTSSLPAGTAQASYSAAVSASGGTTPYSWSVASGSLPPGITLGSSTGALVGTPSASGTFSFSIGVQDSSSTSQHATQALSISIAPAVSTVHISTSSLPAGAVQVAYSAALSATGGTAPYTWSLTGGTLAPGLALSSATGAITGTPTQAGSFLFTATVKDSAGQTASASLSASIAPPASPVVISISPTSGPTSGGTVVTINGSNFASGAVVLFGGAAAGSVKVVSSNQIQAVAPAEIAGTVGVSVQENGQTGSLGGAFTYNALTPTVTSVSPNSGPTAGGTTVTISGSNFLAGALVLFGTVSAPTVNVTSGSQIQAVSPPNASGLTDVTVQNPGNLSGKLPGAFTYNTTSGPPTIGGVSPTSGAPGGQVTLTGTNFASADVVSFGSTNATTTFVSATQLTAVVPSVSAGTYSVTVTDPDPASATLNNAFTVTAPPPSTSLLSGCTVTSSNSPSCSIPSGWTLATCQGFESGTLAPCNGGASNNQATIMGSTIECGFGHSGNCALTEGINFDNASVQWFYSEGQIKREFYLSFWDYGKGMANNEEYVLVHVIKHGLGGSTGFEEAGCGATLKTIQNIFNDPNAKMTGGGAQGNYIANDLFNVPVSGYGSTGWNQWEMQCRENTAGNSDGYIIVWLNGQQLGNLQNQNFSGSVDMTGMDVEAGGWYTKNVWTNNGQPPNAGGTCSANPGQGLEVQGGWIGTFNASPLNAANCPPAPPAFNRYVDDIILLKK
jgi:hypothetical protein